MVKGPLTVTDMICWHAGMGMGLYGVKPLRLGYQNRRRIPRFFHRDPQNVPDVMQRVHWDPEFARRAGNPDHVRLRPHARDVAHPPLHRLDGRRRVAVEARLRVPQVQLRRRHAVAPWARRPQVPGRRRPARGRPRARSGEPAGRGDDTRARDDPAARAGRTARCACRTRRAARATSSTRSKRSRRSSRADDARVPRPPAFRSRSTARCCASRSTAPTSATRSTT